MQELTITNKIIGHTAKIFANYYTHSEINNLFFQANITQSGNGENKLNKIQKTLAELNQNEPDEALKKFKDFISEYCETDFSNDNENFKTQREFVSLLMGNGIITSHEKISNRLTQEELAFINQPIEFTLAHLRQDLLYADIIQQRLDEIKICITNNAPLAAVFLIGSTLEGMLLSLAHDNAQNFNQSQSAPKQKGTVKTLSEWTLRDLITVSSKLGYIGKDTEKFGAGLLNFRNYIHPREQYNEQFNPTVDTAKICLQVLCSAIRDITKKT